MKEDNLEQQIQQGLVELLRRAPTVDVDEHPSYPQLLPDEPKPDIRLRVSQRIEHKNGSFWDVFDLIGEVKSSGQPRIAQSAIFTLRQTATKYNTPLLLVFSAPFISEDVRKLCKQEGIGYFDLAGNAHLAFNGLYIERESAENPFKEVRENRSLFTPKAARILRLLFRDARADAGQPWRVMDLAEKAKVSLGQVSNIGTALVEAGFAQKDERGLSLVEPSKLLSTWVKAYKLPEGKHESFYTALHGNQLTEALHRALGIESGMGRAILSGFSAAQWLAPYARSSSTSIYADQYVLDRLKSELKLGPASRGANVMIKILDDDGPLVDAVQAADGIWCTSPIQTYLDLSWASDRGLEAAAFLHEKWFPWR